MSMWLNSLKFYYGDWTTENNLSFDVNFDDLFTDFDNGRWINVGSRKDDVKTLDRDYSLTFGLKGDDILIVEGSHNIIDGGRDYDMTVAIGDYNFVNGGSGSDLLGAFGHGNILSPGTGDDFVVVGGTGNYMLASPGDDLFDLKGDSTATAVFSGKLSKYSFEEVSLGVYTSTDLRSFLGFDFDGHDTFITDLGMDVGLQVKFLDGTLANVKDLVPNNIPRTVDDKHTQDVDPIKITDYDPDGKTTKTDAGKKLSDVSATANDRDYDGNTLTTERIEVKDTGSSSGTAAEGDLARVEIQVDGSYEVTAKESLFALREGEIAREEYTYTIDDGSGQLTSATLTLEFTGSNSDPFAKNDMASVDENGSVDIMPVANDTDPNVGDTLSLHAIGGIHIDGLLVNDATLFSVLGNTFTFNALGIHFDHLNVGDSSLVAVNYQVADDFGATNDGVMNITVNGINDDPFANNTSAVGTEDSLPSVDTLAAAFDVDDGATLSFGGFSGGDTGDVSEAGGVISVIGGFQHLDDGDSTDVIVTYFIMDEHGAGSNEATATLTVNGLNDAPNQVAGSSIPDQSVTEGNSFVLDLTLGDLFEDVDVEPLTVSTSGLPAWLAFNQDAGLDSLFGTADDVLGFSGTPAIGDSGGTISLIANDGDVNSDAFMFDLTVNPANDGGSGDPDGDGGGNPDTGSESDTDSGGGGNPDEAPVDDSSDEVSDNDGNESLPLGDTNLDDSKTAEDSTANSSEISSGFAEAEDLQETAEAASLSL